MFLNKTKILQVQSGDEEFLISVDNIGTIKLTKKPYPILKIIGHQENTIVTLVGESAMNVYNRIKKLIQIEKVNIKYLSEETFKGEEK